MEQQKEEVPEFTSPPVVKIDYTHQYVWFEIRQNWNTGKAFTVFFNPPLDTVERYAYQFVQSNYGVVVRGVMETRGAVVTHRQLINGVKGDDDTRPLCVAMYQSFAAETYTGEDIFKEIAREEVRLKDTEPVFYQRPETVSAIVSSDE